MRLTEYFANRQKPSTRKLRGCTHTEVRRVGPLEAGYDPSSVPPLERAAGRVTQLIVKMNRAYADGDRDAWRACVPEFDWLCDLIETSGWGFTLRCELWPDFVPEEEYFARMAYISEEDLCHA